MKSSLSEEQSAAIQRFCNEQNAVPMLSVFPFQVNFRIKETKEIITKTLADLVYAHKISKLEEQKTKAQEKKRIESSNKWKSR